MTESSSPGFKHQLGRQLRVLDRVFVKVHLKVLPERAGIRCLLFHNVFIDQEEVEAHKIHPQQPLTIECYRKIFEYFLDHGYEFLSYQDLQGQLDCTKKYLYVTFDDGYYNNTRILPLLEEYKIPAHFFVCPDNIYKGVKFWWDIVYAERKKLLVDRSHIDMEISRLKTYSVKKLHEYLLKEFGKESFSPVGDIDRPFNTNELTHFAQNQWVTIGNHTSNHAILTSNVLTDSRKEIVKAQLDLEHVIGGVPKTFAYPNGNYDSSHIELLSDLGFNLGITCDPRVNKIPADLVGHKRLALGRYCFWGSTNLTWQCDVFRAGWSLYLAVIRYKNKLSSII